MTEITDDIRAKSAALIEKLDTDEDFARRFTEESLTVVAEQGIPEGALHYLASELDKHYAEDPDDDVSGHVWVKRHGKRVWVWRDWGRGF